ncbi:hypothetical protein BCV70DRAFT_6896 [Testicularia cyperi]|uniref:Uncharacterized protein n=1 Tax=Testicularia cyperi TaxID=1882483 RepID=A0A317XX11_9BASI|nr:hypothetical protein BCV70DRAFT_6896 [Testicularia cyperi]
MKLDLTEHRVDTTWDAVCPCAGVGRKHRRGSYCSVERMRERREMRSLCVNVTQLSTPHLFLCVGAARCSGADEQTSQRAEYSTVTTVLYSIVGSQIGNSSTVHQKGPFAYTAHRPVPYCTPRSTLLTHIHHSPIYPYPISLTSPFSAVSESPVLQVEVQSSGRNNSCRRRRRCGIRKSWLRRLSFLSFYRPSCILGPDSRLPVEDSPLRSGGVLLTSI